MKSDVDTLAFAFAFAPILGYFRVDSSSPRWKHGFFEVCRAWCSEAILVVGDAA